MMDGDTSPVVDCVTEERVRGKPAGDDRGFAGSPCHRCDSAQKPQGLIIAFGRQLRCLGEHRVARAVRPTRDREERIAASRCPPGRSEVISSGLDRDLRRRLISHLASASYRFTRPRHSVVRIWATAAPVVPRATAIVGTRRRSSYSSAVIRRIPCRLKKGLEGAAPDPAGPGRRGHPCPELEEPRLGHILGSVEDLRVVAPELLGDAVADARAFPGQLVGDARLLPQFDDGRGTGPLKVLTGTGKIWLLSNRPPSLRTPRLERVVAACKPE